MIESALHVVLNQAMPLEVEESNYHVFTHLYLEAHRQVALD